MEPTTMLVSAELAGPAEPTEEWASPNEIAQLAAIAERAQEARMKFNGRAFAYHY